MGKTFISEEIFTKVKTLEDINFKPKQIAKIVGCSEISVTRIAKATTYTDFKAMRRAQRLAWQEKRAAQLTKVTTEDIAEVSEEVAPLVAEIDKADTLERIAVALERLADAWERQPEDTPIVPKRKFF
jgi:DNA-binding MurR/RpiR family transcriptional regulator